MIMPCSGVIRELSLVQGIDSQWDRKEKRTREYSSMIRELSYRQIFDMASRSNLLGEFNARPIKDAS